MNVFTFVRNNNYRELIKRMIDFSDEISTLAYNFEFVLGKTEYLKQSPEKLKLTNQVIDLYYNSNANANQSGRLGNLLIQQNKREELWQVCEQLEKVKLPYHSHFLKAKWYFKENKLKACLSEINVALSHAVTVQAKAACYETRARCQLKQQHLKACLTNINKAIDISPNNAVYLATKAKAHLQLKQINQAKTLFENVANISNYHLKFDALLYLFDIAFEQGNYEKCESYLTKAEKVKPNNPRIQRKQQQLVSVISS